MRFEGHTITCNSCGTKLAEEENAAHPEADEEKCHACVAKEYKEFIENPCTLCKKPLSRGNLWINEDYEEFVHKACGEKDNIKSKNDEKWQEPEY